MDNYRGLALELADRVRVARRKKDFTQETLAEALHVGRSAVANWERGGASPSTRNLHRMAKVCNVAYEWLATGRGEMALPGHVHDVPAADALLVDDPDEMRLLQGFRQAPPKVKLIMLDLSGLQVVKARPSDGLTVDRSRPILAMATR